MYIGLVYITPKFHKVRTLTTADSISCYWGCVKREWDRQSLLKSTIVSYKIMGASGRCGAKLLSLLVIRSKSASYCGPGLLSIRGEILRQERRVAKGLVGGS